MRRRAQTMGEVEVDLSLELYRAFSVRHIGWLPPNGCLDAVDDGKLGGYSQGHCLDGGLSVGRGATHAVPKNKGTQEENIHRLGFADQR